MGKGTNKKHYGRVIDNFVNFIFTYSLKGIEIRGAKVGASVEEPEVG